MEEITQDNRESLDIKNELFDLNGVNKNKDYKILLDEINEYVSFIKLHLALDTIDSLDVDNCDEIIENAILLKLYFKTNNTTGDNYD